MSKDHLYDDVYVDANGFPTERVSNEDGPDIIVHYGDIPESDVTVVDGIRCTTALRTVIDIAPELDPKEWEQAIRTCLQRGLFTREEALQRTGEPDMRDCSGAQALRRALSYL